MTVGGETRVVNPGTVVWAPADVPHGVDEALERTVAWYRDNREWWEPIRSGDYRAYYERQYGRSLG